MRERDFKSKIKEQIVGRTGISNPIIKLASELTSDNNSLTGTFCWNKYYQGEYGREEMKGFPLVNTFIRIIVGKYGLNAVVKKPTLPESKVEAPNKTTLHSVPDVNGGYVCMMPLEHIRLVSPSKEEYLYPIENTVMKVMENDVFESSRVSLYKQHITQLLNNRLHPLCPSFKGTCANHTEVFIIDDLTTNIDISNLKEVIVVRDHVAFVNKNNDAYATRLYNISSIDNIKKLWKSLFKTG